MPVVGVIPKEGVTGWPDTWMLSSKAKHPNCAYKWMQYITQPKPQAQQAIYFGETPVNKKACAIMNTLVEGLVRAVLGQRARELLQLDQVLEDADRRLRQRPEELHRPQGLDDGLDSRSRDRLAVSDGRARVTEGSPRGGALRSLSRFSWRRPGPKTFGQISAPVAAFLFVYVAALVALLIQGFWTTDSFTGKVVHSWNLDNFRAIATAPYPTIILRTLVMASAVTVTCMLLAFPYAYFLVRDRRTAASARAARRDGAAALGELSRARVLVAADPQPGRRAQLVPQRPRPARPEHRLHELGDVARVHLHLVPVHGAAGLCGARARAVLVPRGLGRPRRAAASRRCAG